MTLIVAHLVFHIPCFREIDVITRCLEMTCPKEGSCRFNLACWVLLSGLTEENIYELEMGTVNTGTGGIPSELHSTYMGPVRSQSRACLCVVLHQIDFKSGKCNKGVT